MNASSRTHNSVKNFTIATIAQLLTMVMVFVTRTFFIKILNADYLGVNGLFSNILSILSFSELGISGAIVYNMYKPALNDDKLQLSGLYNLYKTAYTYVAIVVAVLGVLVAPFLKYIINEPPKIEENLTIIYLLFLANTVCSYILSYSKSLFTAFQKDYVNVLVDRGIWMLMSICQLLYLLLTHDFYGYLFIQIIATFSINLIITIKCNRKFSDIIHLNCRLSREKIKKIFIDIYSIFFYKVGSIVLNATNNIVIAKLINITVVGICSNFILITSTVENLLNKGLNSIVSSIGNLNATDNKTSQANVLYELSLGVSWLYGICTIELSLMLNPFIKLWIGDVYTLDQITVYSIVSTFYIFGSNFIPSSFRLTMGFFREAKYVPLIASVLNIILAFILGKQCGLFGIYLATTIARIVTFNIIDPYLVVVKGLHDSLHKYYLYNIYLLLITIVILFVCKSVCNYTTNEGFWAFICNILIVFVVSSILYYMFTFWMNSFKRLKQRVINNITSSGRCK